MTTLASAKLGAAFKEVSFAASDGGQIFANLYGKGSHAVVLPHGAANNRELAHAGPEARGKRTESARN